MNHHDELAPVDPEDRAAVLEAIYLFHRHIDRGEATKALSLVAEDADFTIRGQRMRGVDEVAEFLAWREQQTDRKTLHLIESPVIAREQDGAITVEAVLAMHASDDGGVLHLTGAFEIAHTLVRATDRWQIRDRTMSPIHSSTH